MVVGGSKLVVVAVVRIVCSCVSGELYSSCCLSQKFLEGKMCGDAARFFDGVLFVGGDWFNRESGGGQNGCGSG